MIRFVSLMGAILAFALSMPALAQDSTETSAAEGIAMPSARDILDAIFLPQVAADARREGVPEADIQVVLDASRERRLPPSETRGILEETTEAVKANGPVDNFGAFLQAKLEAGLRGRDLAQAIAAEHRARGKGKGHGAEHGQRPGSIDDVGDPAGGPPHDGKPQGQAGGRENDPGRGKRDQGKGQGSGGGS